VTRRTVLACTFALLALLLSAAPAFAGSGLKSNGPVEFGSVDVHFGGSPRTQVQIENVSGSMALLSPVSIEGAQNFSVVADYCSNQTLGPAMSCSVEVEFQPQTAGAKSATLSVSGGEGTVEVPLSGEGVTGTLSANPNPVVFSPIPYARPEQEGEGNENEQVNVLDSVAGTWIESVSIVGPDASSFSIQYGNCEHDLMASGNTCDAGIRFEPRSAGAKHAVLLIESDATDGTLEVPLEGTALEGPSLILSSRQALLGEVTIGGSAENVFTLSNNGDYPLYIERSFLVSGTPLMFPTLADSCSGHAIQPGATCSMTIGFQPSTPGEKSAGMILITNATPSIQVIGVDGIGVLPFVASPPPTPVVASPASGPPILSSVRSPHLQGGPTLHTGFLSRCPTGSGGCQIVTRVTTAKPHTPGGEAGTMLVGSSSTRLAEGTAASVHVHLTPRVTAALNLRLKRQGRLTVTITTEVRAGAKTLATKSRTLVLVAGGPGLTNY
jgi:hypothetical protein